MRLPVLALLTSLAVAACSSCDRKKPASASGDPDKPSLRFYALGTVAGALEPCGCVKNMLGGVDHAAALVLKNSNVPRLVAGAGPMLFENPIIEQKSRTQSLWKAEVLAQSLAQLGMVGWSPGANDWAAGEQNLRRLSAQAGAKLIASNLRGQTAGAAAVHVAEVAGYRVGVAGVSVPRANDKLPDNVRAADPVPELERALRTLREKRAQILIALASMPRGDAIRMIERVEGFHVLVVGKPFDQGETNDGTVPPMLIGKTLVIQPPNHLQGLAVVDWFVRSDSFDFEDGSGVAAAEERTSLEQRIAELERRVAGWKRPEAGVSKQDLRAREADLGRLKARLSELGSTKSATKGSFFRYELVPVREDVGVHASTAQRMKEYYKRVNGHNRVAFKDRKPPPLADGQAGFVGIEQCSDCHEEAYDFWKKTGHAKAYETLSRDHKEFNLDCVSCHVTGYEQPGGSTVTHVEHLKDVQCETCHGPGSLHVDDPENEKLISAAPERSLCAPLCHHPPHVKEDWDVNLAFGKIIGPGHGAPLPATAAKPGK
jgi:hypothetical protein